MGFHRANAPILASLLALAASLVPLGGCSVDRFSSSSDEPAPARAAEPGGGEAPDIFSLMVRWHRGNALRSIADGEAVATWSDSSGADHPATAIATCSETTPSRWCTRLGPAFAGPFAPRAFSSLLAPATKLACKRVSGELESYGIDFRTDGTTETFLPDVFSLKQQGEPLRAPFTVFLVFKDAVTYLRSESRFANRRTHWLAPALQKPILGAEAASGPGLVVSARDGFVAVGIDNTGAPGGGLSSHFADWPPEQKDLRKDGLPQVLMVSVAEDGYAESWINGKKICGSYLQSIDARPNENDFRVDPAIRRANAVESFCPGSKLAAPAPGSSKPISISAPTMLGGTFASDQPLSGGNQPFFNGATYPQLANQRVYQLMMLRGAMHEDRWRDYRQGVLDYLLSAYRPEAAQVSRLEDRSEKSRATSRSLAAADAIGETGLTASALAELPPCPSIGACGEPYTTCGGGGGGGAR